MSYRVITAEDAFWRPSNQMGVANTDLAKQLGAETLGARLWRLEPGQASTRHRHLETAELYVVLEGTGRLAVEDEVLTLTPLSAVLVEPATVRQPFNDTDADAAVAGRRGAARGGEHARDDPGGARPDVSGWSPGAARRARRR